MNIVRVNDGEGVSSHDAIYSGRSSWSDLLRSEPNKSEHVELELASGVKRHCRKFIGFEKKATCDGSRIEKSEVVRGYYVRFAPATYWEHYVARESALLLAPRTWFGSAFFPKIKVLLYDAAVLERERGNHM